MPQSHSSVSSHTALTPKSVGLPTTLYCLPPESMVLRSPQLDKGTQKPQWRVSFGFIFGLGLYLRGPCSPRSGSWCCRLRSSVISYPGRLGLGERIPTDSKEDSGHWHANVSIQVTHTSHMYVRSSWPTVCSGD